MIAKRRIFKNNSFWYVSIPLLLALMFNVLLIQSCGGEPETSPVTSTDTPIWMVQDSRFITNDVNRAQAEIPFPLRLPTIFPSTEEVTLPEIQGPIRNSSANNDIIVSVKYFLSPSKGAILIDEHNKPIVPEDPNINPKYKSVEIGGKEVIETEGEFGFGKGVIYYFNLNEIYYRVEIDNLSPENSVKIVESIIVRP